MTQQVLAEAIGIARASYANLESGRQRIPLDVAWRAAVVLQTSISSLVPEAVYSNATDDTAATDNPQSTNTNIISLLQKT